METTLWFTIDEVLKVIPAMEQILKDFSVKCNISVGELDKDSKYPVTFTPELPEELFWIGVAWARASK